MSLAIKVVLEIAPTPLFDNPVQETTEVDQANLEVPPAPGQETLVDPRTTAEDQAEHERKKKARIREEKKHKLSYCCATFFALMNCTIGSTLVNVVIKQIHLN